MLEKLFDFKIGVIGSKFPSEFSKQQAFILGQLLAEHRCAVICGGLQGVMEEVCRGAKSKGGITVGLLPGKNDNDANPFVDIIIPTTLGEIRNNLIINASHGIIAVEGESGTLNELTTAWMSQKPIAVLKNTGGWSAKLANSKIDNQYQNFIYGAETPQDAVDYILKKLGKKP